MFWNPFDATAAAAAAGRDGSWAGEEVVAEKVLGRKLRRQLSVGSGRGGVSPYSVFRGVG